MAETIQRGNASLKTLVRKNPSSPTKMSLSKFWRITDGKFAEWVDGEVTYMTVTSPHQNIVEFFAALMRHLSEDKKLGKVRTAPYSMKLPKMKVVREPDIMFVRTEHLDRLTDQCLNGACDIAIEVISPDSRTRDRRDKFSEYAQAGVSEYWMIDESRKWAQFYSLDADGVYVLIQLDEQGVFRSAALPGFWIKPSWLWQNELPTINEVQRLWGLI